MAVKKHELVADNRRQLDLAALAQYIQLMNEQPTYLPPPHELVKNCQDIVKCLSRATGTEQELWQLLRSIEEFLLRVVNTVNFDVRHEIITAVMDKFYSYISDPQSDACPATSVVLIVIDESEAEAGLSSARWLVQKDSGPAGAGLRSALSCLYRWLAEWHGTPLLGSWIICFIKALEENELFDILIEVSVDNIANLFTALNNPVPLRLTVADVILHVLASLQECAEAFDRISPHVGEVLVSLAEDSGQWSRQLLQNLVDILTAMMNHNIETLRGDNLYIFRDEYAHVIQCLERHMASGECELLQLQPWKTRKVGQPSMEAKTPVRKVGLLNLGNTCYMNSVMQALLVARQFSTHVVLNMNAMAYWSRMGVLFAKMMHSITTKLNPGEFFSVVKPPFFTRDNQHDSSEFLGYLFELLQSYEHSSDRNFDYTRPAVLNANRFRFIHPHAQALPSCHYSEEHSEPNRSRRSCSPRPGSSTAAGSCSSALKRPGDSDGAMGSQRKRLRMSETVFLRRESFVDSMFGGVLLTRIECVQCRSSSLSRDVFRDLQLAFPEKPEGWQHSVQSLLEYYCSKESLTGDNQYECNDCGGLRDAERSVIIETTPKYLILVLKNFKFNAKLQVQTKLMLSVLHNMTITLPTVRSQQDHSSYVLFAAVIHAGTTLDSGHYYTLAKDRDQWFMYNDDVVTFADEMELSKLNRASTPYILFYRRTDVEEGAAPALDQLPPRVQETVLAHNKEYVETVRNLCRTRP